METLNSIDEKIGVQTVKQESVEKELVPSALSSAYRVTSSSSSSFF